MKRLKRSPLLTGAAASLLRRLVEESEKEDGEQLTEFRPGGWWLGEDRVRADTCLDLLRMTMIRTESTYSSTTYYQPSPEAKQLLDNPDYIPRIIEFLSSQRIPERPS